MSKSMKQKLRRMQEKLTSAKWLPKLKHWNYNSEHGSDSVQRIRMSVRLGKVQH